MPGLGVNSVSATNSDGTLTTVTINYDPATGALLNASVNNQSPSVVHFVVTDPQGAQRTVPVQPGLTLFTAADLAAAGFTNNSQFARFTLQPAVR